MSVEPVLTPEEIKATIETIADWQLPNGMIPWFPGGHSDPWNHVEAAMALTLGGLDTEAERAYEWLAANQHRDGSWCNYYIDRGNGQEIEDPKRDTNTIAYVAAGVWHHWLVTGDRGFLEGMFPMVEQAVGFVLDLQQPGGEILWAIEPDGSCPRETSGREARYALLTGSSSIHHSLRCAVAVAEALGLERPDWELAAGRLAHAIAHQPDAFEPKDRWAMDWYYPVLSGAVTDRAHLDERWDEFTIELSPGAFGVRCVSDNEWVTAAETAECAMAYDAVGHQATARSLLAGTTHLRDDDGAYWTGIVLPDGIHFPDAERTTYTAAAVVLAHTALTGDGPVAGLFRGDGIPESVQLVPEVAPER